MEATQNHSDAASSFAGALAAFAAEAAGLKPDPHDDGLADDIAILSYEGTVRRQTSRVHAGPAQASLAQASLDPTEVDIRGPGAQGKDSAHPEDEPDRKSASITIRISQAECAQLRKRADQASLTVSAYMRSCVLEAETLRAQVKEALAELRAATPDEPLPTLRTQRRWWHLGARSN
jgi:Mobilization protein NikA